MQTSSLSVQNNFLEYNAHIIINEYSRSYQGRAQPFGTGWLTAVETVGKKHIYFLQLRMYHLPHFLNFHRLQNEYGCESTMNHGNMVDFHSKYKSSIVESSILRELDLVCSGHEEVHKGFVIRRKSEEWAMFFKNDVLMRCIDAQIKVNHRIVSINVFIHVIVPAGNPLI